MAEERPYEIQTHMADGRTITLYRRKHTGLPLVLLNSYMEFGEDILHSCQRHGCRAFQLLSVSGLAWDQCLSPWPAPKTVSDEDDFTGGAQAYSRWLSETVLPYARGELGEVECTVLGGYSMGGLFAVYAPYVTGDYDRIISASGSLWYPGFLKYARTTPFVRRPQSIYFSLGNQESRTKHPALATTQTNTEELSEYYAGLGIDTVFELNPGNHYQDAPARMAKGITWTLRQKTSG